MGSGHASPTVSDLIVAVPKAPSHTIRGRAGRFKMRFRCGAAVLVDRSARPCQESQRTAVESVRFASRHEQLTHMLFVRTIVSNKPLRHAAMATANRIDLPNDPCHATHFALAQQLFT